MSTAQEGHGTAWKYGIIIDVIPLAPATDSLAACPDKDINKQFSQEPKKFQHD